MYCALNGGKGGPFWGIIAYISAICKISAEAICGKGSKE